MGKRVNEEEVKAVSNTLTAQMHRHTSGKIYVPVLLSV